MVILAIESSCDETAAAVAKGNGESVSLLSNVVSSQIHIHQKYGGVVPEVAAREHVLNILPVIEEALNKAGIKRKDAAKRHPCMDNRQFTTTRSAYHHFSRACTHQR